MTEEEYDTLIAPALADLAKKIRELGGSIVARVEWDTDGAGITCARRAGKISAAQRMTELSALSRGNFDAVCIELLKEVDCTGSMFLRPFATPRAMVN